MGADGGIKGIAIREIFLNAPSNELNYALYELRANIPWPFYYIDNRNENLDALDVAPSGYFYSTYGSFQEFDIEDLIYFINSAEEYIIEHPKAIFKDWIEEVYINWDSIWEHEGIRYLARTYLHLGPYTYSGNIKSPVFKENDTFITIRISYFVNLINTILDLEQVLYSEETWT